MTTPAAESAGGSPRACASSTGPASTISLGWRLRTTSATSICGTPTAPSSHARGECFQRALGGYAEIIAPRHARQAQEQQRHHRIPRRLRAVVIVFEPKHKIRSLRGVDGNRRCRNVMCAKKPPSSLSSNSSIARSASCTAQVRSSAVERGFVQVEEPETTEGVVVQESVDGRFALAIAAQQNAASARPTDAFQKIGGAARGARRTLARSKSARLWRRPKS